ncbi:MAG: M1 family aminopeptidase, partial [Gemmatimonadales bacterium]
NLHRIEGGGTEFPMVIMDGSAGLGLIVHELGHNYTMGILANNEWKEGWLDEGFTSFQTGWFFEANGQGPAYPEAEGEILFWDIDRWSEPVSMVSERYRDFQTYNTMIYTKGQLFFEQLRYVVGDDVMRQILRTYYARWRLKHVDEAAFRGVAEAVSHMDLGWLFGQWLHGTPLIDYKLTKVERRRLADGRWQTAAIIDRLGDGWMPVEIGDKNGIYARSTGEPLRERVEFVTDHKPGRLALDPRQRAHDWNALNNHERRGLFGSRARSVVRFDNPTKNPARRDGIVMSLLPIAWYNDHGGWTGALRMRSNYLGRFHQDLTVYSYAFGPDAKHRDGFFFRFANPVNRPMPRTETSAAFWRVEGRTGIALRADKSLIQHLGFGPDRHVGFDAIWMAVHDLGYVDRRLWDNSGTIEAGPWASIASRNGGGGSRVWHARFGVRGGLVYRNPGPGIQATNRYDVEGFARATGEVSLRTHFLGVRLFGGTYLAEHDPPLQRRIMARGADPYETFANPLLRSRGAPFVRPDFHYHAPGDANLRGFRPDLGGRWAVALNMEATKTLGLPLGAAAHVFVDAGIVDPQAVPPIPSGQSYSTLYDGGVGIVLRPRINDLAWTMRFEVPFVVNRWDHAADGTTDRFAFRWQVSLEPSF